MKRLIIVLLSPLALVLGIAACGGGSGSGQSAGECVSASSDGLVIAVQTTPAPKVPPEGCGELANLVVTASFLGKPEPMPRNPGTPVCSISVGSFTYAFRAEPGGSSEAEDVCQTLESEETFAGSFAWLNGHPTVNYQQQYLQDVAPMNSAVHNFNLDKSSINSSSDPVVQALAQATLAVSRELLQQSWPPSARADVHALALAVAKESADLDSDATMEANLATDAATSFADANVVRADLGLPPASANP